MIEFRILGMGYRGGKGRIGGNALRVNLPRALVTSALAVLLLSTVAVASVRPSLDSYRADTARVKAFLIDYLAENWGLAGDNTDKLVDWVIKYSLKNDTDPLVQMARILNESRGRHFTLNSRGERRVVKGASREIGLSQVHPFWIGKQVGGVKITKEMLLDPEGNVMAGVILYKRYDYGDYLAALTHYNNPRAKSPSRYALVVDRIYKRMLALYIETEPDPLPVESPVGSAIVIC